MENLLQAQSPSVKKSLKNWGHKGDVRDILTFEQKSSCQLRAENATASLEASQDKQFMVLGGHLLV
jgi:hypothetical protein